MMSRRTRSTSGGRERISMPARALDLLEQRERVDVGRPEADHHAVDAAFAEIFERLLARRSDLHVDVVSLADERLHLGGLRPVAVDEQKAAHRALEELRDVRE